MFIALILMSITACDDAPAPPPGPPADPSQLPDLADNAPVDRPFTQNAEILENRIQSLAGESRAELPQVRGRFLAGLGDGHHLSVTTRLHSEGAFEQVFVFVRAWPEPDRIEGVLGNEVTTPGYALGQPMQLSMSEVLDWTISRPDGAEEGNRIGRFLDREQGH